MIIGIYNFKMDKIRFKYSCSVWVGAVQYTVKWETFEGENFRKMVGYKKFAEKTFVDC